MEKGRTINENNQLTLGDMIWIKTRAPQGGERGYVYETYPDFDEKAKIGVSIITETGRDTGGWSWDEQKMFLESLERPGWDYEFKNVIQLDRDFQDGVFNRVFK